MFQSFEILHKSIFRGIKHLLEIIFFDGLKHRQLLQNPTVIVVQPAVDTRYTEQIKPRKSNVSTSRDTFS